MTVKERVKELVKAVAYLNGFDKVMSEIGFEWNGEKSNNNNPLNACDLIVHEIAELLQIDMNECSSDILIHEISNTNRNTIDTYEKQFDIIWKEFGTDEY